MVSVIIVDDDQEAIDSLSTYLKLHNIDTLDYANNGLTVLEKYEKLKPDFVITDYNMPEYDGLFVIQSLKKFDPKARIILLSANLSTEIKLQSFAFESVNILEKPFNAKELLEMLK